MLLQFKGVAEAIAFPVSSVLYGQEIEAAVVLLPEFKGKITEQDLIRFLKNHLVAFKIPRKIYLVDVLPKTPTGKVQRRVVADVFANKSKL